MEELPRSSLADTSGYQAGIEAPHRTKPQFLTTPSGERFMTAVVYCQWNRLEYNTCLFGDDCPWRRVVDGTTATVVLCQNHVPGLARKTGSGTQNRNGPKGASHFWYLTPFSGERFNPVFWL